MAALLVALAVMGVLASAAMPTWRQMARREKEAELIFRGQQYARAIGLFQRRAGPGVNPPNLDVLVQQRFLRKKYKDPITGGDFELISPVSAMSVPGAATPGAPTTRGGPSTTPTAPAGRGYQTVTPIGGGGTPPGGVVGVASKSKEKSIRIYNGRNFYNEWQFVFVPQVQQPAGGGPDGRGGPQRGGPQRGPGFGSPGFPGGGRGPAGPAGPSTPRGRGAPIQPPR